MVKINYIKVFIRVITLSQKKYYGHDASCKEIKIHRLKGANELRGTGLDTRVKAKVYMQILFPDPRMVGL